MNIFVFLDLLVWYVVITICLGVIVLVVLRLVVTYADLNPFGWIALNVRRTTDPMVNPIRRGLARSGLDPKFAPLLTILITILLGYFAYSLVHTVLWTLDGIIESASAGRIIRLVGFVLYGLLALYSLLIFIRIIFSWGVSSINPVMRFLIILTEPVLGPFRRLIPPLGMFDISPIVVLVLIDLFQRAIAGTLLAR
ncbi:MAG: YggT family protein [Pyrinomonadaceae bacterium]|nr:YggT family protein [Pyrinomonadaceae bacterium]